jgi:hypothetical protein
MVVVGQGQNRTGGRDWIVGSGLLVVGCSVEVQGIC